jgi:ABC-type multidrug transport system ATPase subunit
VILVTHQIQHLKEVKKIVVLDQGKIKMEGTYQELKHLGLDFDKILETYHDREEKEDEIFDEEDKESDEGDLKFPDINAHRKLSEKSEITEQNETQNNLIDKDFDEADLKLVIFG